MGSHRAPPRRLPAPPGRRRAEPVRPRYGRLAVLGASLSVVGVAVLGGVGVLPSVASGGGQPGSIEAGTGQGGSGKSGAADTTRDAAGDPASTDTRASTDEQDTAAGAGGTGQATTAEADPAVPPDSGEGRRVVFDQSAQRVWLVREDGTVARAYLVSGSVYDNLHPGTYEVYSRSAHATGIDESGTMRYFVRFTEGDGGAAIGFHDIPVSNGEPVQTTSQLGTPQSHGCIRQARRDAIALWGFAPIGTEVDVVA